MLLLTVATLMLGTFAVLRPFLPAIVWAAIVVVATWPILLRVENLFGGHRRLAVAGPRTEPVARRFFIFRLFVPFSVPDSCGFHSVSKRVDRFS